MTMPLAARTHAAINPDVMMYFVLCQHKSGLEWTVRDPANMSRRDTIADIMTGDLENVVTILECNPVEHVCSDVTGDILAEAARLLTVGQQRFTGQDFIDWKLDHARELRREEV